ncbi:MAG: acyl carrier protein [Jiangellaceae bacterium]
MHSNLADIDVQVRALLEERLKVSGNGAVIAGDASLSDLGLDSIAILSMVVGLEQEFDVEIPDQDVSLDNFGSVASIVRYVAGQLDRWPPS